jgi:type II secretory pathway pseudopilin PulG
VTSAFSAKRGLTFIEILFVIILTGILIGVSIPRFRKSFDSLELNSFSRELQSFMNYLSERAIVDGEPIYLYFEVDKKLAWAKSGQEEGKLKTIKIPEEIELGLEKGAVAFYPDGKIDKVTITLTNRSNKEVTLTTKGIASGVKIINEK